MTTKVATTLPDYPALRALYDEAVAELNSLRSNILTTDFYAKTGYAVFNAGCLALSDAVANNHIMRVVSAPAGGGKTTFSYALAAAVTRYAESNPDAPYGVVFVVDQIERADKVYRELSALLPGKVLVWTTEHDCNCKELKRITEPAIRSTQDELRHYPVAVVTHKFYLDNNGHKARRFERNGVCGQRALTMVDERPNEAPTLEIEQLSDAQAVREKLREERPETREYLDALLSFMEPYSYAAPNKLSRPGIEADYDKVTKSLGWFQTDAAQHLAQSLRKRIPGIENTFAFAKALSAGRAFVVTDAIRPYFVAYDDQRIIKLTAGTVLLDATADIDGVSNISPGRVHIETPKARYDNLEIIHVPKHTKKNLAEYLKKAPNQRAYVNWMLETITQHMVPGEKGLVVCKLALIDAQRIPTWPEDDPRFKQHELYTEQYGWDVGGRSLCVTHWGTGVGSNAWQDADVVFLFDEHFIPRRTHIGTTQALRGHRAYEGDLGSMRAPNSKAGGVDAIAEGHLLRWTKQLALRGRARVYDANGLCGKQRLVVSSDLKRFMAHAGVLFPGAKITTEGNLSDHATWITRILELLSKTQDRVVRTKDFKKLVGRPWRDLRSNVLTADFEIGVMALGWRYVSAKGRNGARFERLSAAQEQTKEPLLSSPRRPTVELGVLSGLSGAA